MEQVVSVFAPVFVIAALGYLCGRLGLLGPAGPTVLSRFVFFVAMPPLIFITLASRRPNEVAHWGYLGAYFLAILTGGLVFLAAARALFRERGRSWRSAFSRRSTATPGTSATRSASMPSVRRCPPFWPPSST